MMQVVRKATYYCSVGSLLPSTQGTVAITRVRARLDARIQTYADASLRSPYRRSLAVFVLYLYLVFIKPPCHGARYACTEGHSAAACLRVCIHLSVTHTTQRDGQRSRERSRQQRSRERSEGVGRNSMEVQIVHRETHFEPFVSRRSPR